MQRLIQVFQICGIVTDIHPALSSQNLPVYSMHFSINNSINPLPCSCRSSSLPLQWGIWVAWAMRAALWTAPNLTPPKTVYQQTMTTDFSSYSETTATHSPVTLTQAHSPPLRVALGMLRARSGYPLLVENCCLKAKILQLGHVRIRNGTVGCGCR